MITVTQPQFFPPLFMFVRFAQCDKIVFMEEAQYSVSGGHSRLVAKSSESNVTIPLTLIGRGRKPLCDIGVSKEQHLFIKNINEHYKDSPRYGDSTLPFVLSLMDNNETSLSGFNISIIKSLLSSFAINCTVLKSREVVPNRPENPTEWISYIAMLCNEQDYIQGRVGIESYLEIDKFKAKNINVWAQNTISTMPISESVLSFIFKYGVIGTMRIIRALAKQKPDLVGNHR